MKDEGQSKGNIIMVTDGPSIPNPREWRLINAWSIALCGAIITLVLLCTTGPQVYRDAIIFLPDGLLLTFKVTAYSICGAVPLGLLTGLGRISRNRFFNLLASTYVEVIRGIPLLVQIFYIYFAISMLVKMEGVTSAVIALSFCYGAYMGEVFRAGILSVPKGQTEAARSLGFNNFQTMTLVILPQAMRTILPPIGNECIAMLKDTSLVSIIAVAEGAINCEEAGMKRKEWMAKRAEAGFGTTATNRIAQAVQKKTGMETRVCIPGHMQRGGSPSAYDRVLATQFGSYAAKLVEIERYGVTVAMVNRHVTENRLADIAGKTRNVPENCDLLTVARRMGISLG